MAQASDARATERDDHDPELEGLQQRVWNGFLNRLAEADPEHPWTRCVCTHMRAAHKTYSRNGKDTTRCTGCDPLAGRKTGGVVVMVADTFTAAMYAAADHEFQPAAQPTPEAQ